MTPSADNPEPTQDASSGRGGGEGRGDSTGLPCFRTWRGVYIFAFACFIVYVVLLTLFSRAFS